MLSPPWELAFFDPGKEEYVTLHSPVLSLQMVADPAATAGAAAAVLSQIGMQGEQLDDILFIHTGTPSLRPLTGSLVAQPGFWVWQLPFSAVLGLAGGWGWKRWSAWKEEQRRKFEMTLEKVKARSHQNLSRTEFYELVLDYFERWKVKNPQLPAGLSTCPGDDRPHAPGGELGALRRCRRQSRARHQPRKARCPLRPGGTGSACPDGLTCKRSPSPSSSVCPV